MTVKKICKKYKLDQLDTYAIYNFFILFANFTKPAIKQKLKNTYGFIKGMCIYNDIRTAKQNERS